MDCALAQRTVLLNIADAALLAEARLHIQNCEHCGGNKPSAHKALTEQLSRRTQRSMIGRIVLGSLGLFQLALALPWLFGSSPFWESTAQTAQIHLARDGAIGVVFALIALSVAISPRLAIFSLPVALVMLLIQVATGFFDKSQSHVHVGFEWIHVLIAAISIGVSMLARPKRRSSSTH